MAREPQRPSFWISIFALVLYTLACGAIPVYHQISGRELKPALTVNLDSIYLFMFLLGVGAIVAITALNRRVAALEKKIAQER
jgi:hypothetical protein